MMAPQIKLELLREWKKKGELLIIWRCEKCFIKIPFYKSGSPFIDSIYLWWAHDHKYCDKCKKEKNNNPKEENTEDKRIKNLLEKYEPPEEWNLNI